MNNLRPCSCCSKKLPEHELYFIEKNWISFDCACSTCLNQESRKIVIPDPLLTVEQYLNPKQATIPTKTISDETFTRRVEKGIATIKGRRHSVILEEETTVVKRIILEQ